MLNADLIVVAVQSARFVADFWSHVARTESCWLWTGCHYKGYGYKRLAPPHGRLRARAHRVSWVIHNGPIPDGLCVLHDCPDGDNGMCVNPAHLWLGTDADNVRDCTAKRRGTGKLTDELVRQIRHRQVLGATQAVLARDFDLNRSTIRAVVHRRAWKHVL